MAGESIDSVVRLKPEEAANGLPPWWQAELDNAQLRKGDLRSAYDAATIPSPAGIYMSPETRSALTETDLGPEAELRSEAIVDRLGQVAAEQGQKVIVISPHDLDTPAPYNPVMQDNNGPNAIKFGLTESFAGVAAAGGLNMDLEVSPNMMQEIAAVPGSAAALPLDDRLHPRALRENKPEHILSAQQDVCVVTMPTNDGLMPLQYPNNLSLLDQENTYSNEAPIYERDYDGALLGNDPKGDMRLYLGRHEIDHCTNLDGSQPYPEYVSDTNAARGYAKDYAEGLATDATVPHFLRTLRAENTLIDMTGEGDKYILNGIATLPGEGAPLTPDQQTAAAEEIKEARAELYENAGISQEMMANPEELPSNRYALYNTSKDMLREGDLDDKPYARALFENFVEGAERYQPESYQVEEDSLRTDPVQLKPESYGISATPQLPNFQFQGQAAAAP